MSINKVILVGRVGKDPEIKQISQSFRVANLTVATSEKWKDKNTGEKKEKTEWHRVVVKNDGLVGVVERFVSKGDNIYIEGSLETREWSGSDGVKKYATEIVLSPFNGKIDLLGGKSDGNSAPKAQPKAEPAADVIDDDIPF